MVMGDMNANVGYDNTGFEDIMGKKGIGKINENGELFANFCALHDLVIGGTIFLHKTCHLATWVSPDLKTENQIDHICIFRKFRRSLQVVRAKRGADAASDHHLLVANIKLKLKKHQVGVPAGIRYDVKKLKDHNKQVEFQLELRNRFSALQNRERKITVQ